MGGRQYNAGSGSYSSITGGINNTASGQFSSLSGGTGRSVAGQYEWRAGDLYNEPDG